MPTGVNFADNGNGTATMTGTPANGTGGVYSALDGPHQRHQPRRDAEVHPHGQTGHRDHRRGRDHVHGGNAGTFTVTTTGTPRDIQQSGPLPTGVTFMDNGNGTATLAGTPAEGGGGPTR